MLIFLSFGIIISVILAIFCIVQGITGNDNVCLGIGCFMICFGLLVLISTVELDATQIVLKKYKKIMIENNVAEYNSSGEFIIKESD